MESTIIRLKEQLQQSISLHQQIIRLRDYVATEKLVVSQIEDGNKRAWEEACLSATEGRIEELEEELASLQK
jgi:hypothetical protein